MMDEVIKKIVGGAIVLVIGGTGFVISQSDVIDNFAEETGMSQQQAQQYVDDAQGDLESFAKIGRNLVEDGNSLLGIAAGIDCTNYTYEWETPSLDCFEGKDQMHTIGNSAVKLGSCYKTLDTELGSSVKSQIRECINYIDRLNAGYDLPIVAKLLDNSDVTESKNANSYNKSVLRAALESE